MEDQLSMARMVSRDIESQTVTDTPVLETKHLPKWLIPCSRPFITLNLYSHVISEIQDELADAVADVLSG